MVVLATSTGWPTLLQVHVVANGIGGLAIAITVDMSKTL